VIWFGSACATLRARRGWLAGPGNSARAGVFFGNRQRATGKPQPATAHSLPYL